MFSELVFKISKISRQTPFVLCLILCGCASPAVVPSQTFYFQSASVEDNGKWLLVDNRREDAKTFRMSSDGSDYYLGDNNFQPGRLQILRDQLFVLLKDSNVGGQLQLETFEVIVYDPTGKVGTSNMAMNSKGLVPTAAGRLRQVDIPKSVTAAMFPEDLAVTCIISGKVEQEAFQAKDYNMYARSKLNEGLIATITQTIQLAAEQIRSKAK